MLLLQSLGRRGLKEVPRRLAQATVSRFAPGQAQDHSCNFSADSGKDVRDVIIIGSGPAGYTAALYAARANMSPLVLAGVQHGGQLMLTSDVENFPGYPHPIGGPELMQDLSKQAERFGAEIVFRDATSVDTSQRPFRVTSRKKQYLARSLIIATGAEAIWLGAEGEAELKGRGVSTCATCDGAFYKDQQVIVVGGGDSAMEEALFLTKFASQVTIVHRRDFFRASKIMLDRAASHRKVTILRHRTVRRWVSEDGLLSGAELVDPRDETSTSGAQVEVLPCKGAFVSIGHRPMTAFLRRKGAGAGGAAPAGGGGGGEEALVELDEEGYVVQREHTMTSLEGVFACGDVVDKRYRQAITAAGMGCQAAIDCERWLADQP